VPYQGLVLEKVAQAVVVTPQAADAVTELKANCPCGNADLWVLDAPRTLTTCVPSKLTRMYVCNQEGSHGSAAATDPCHLPPLASCDDVWWYEGAPIGTELYATFFKETRVDGMETGGDCMAARTAGSPLVRVAVAAAGAELRITPFMVDQNQVRGRSWKCHTKATGR